MNSLIDKNYEKARHLVRVVTDNGIPSGHVSRDEKILSKEMAPFPKLNTTVRYSTSCWPTYNFYLFFLLLSLSQICPEIFKSVNVFIYFCNIVYLYRVSVQKYVFDLPWSLSV